MSLQAERPTGPSPMVYSSGWTLAFEEPVFVHLEVMDVCNFACMNGMGLVRCRPWSRVRPEQFQNNLSSAHKWNGYE